MAGVTGGVGMIEIVLNLRIGVSLDEQPHHRQVTVLRGHVQRGQTLAMGEASEGGFPVDGGSVVEEPRGRFDAVACRRPEPPSSIARPAAAPWRCPASWLPRR